MHIHPPQALPCQSMPFDEGDGLVVFGYGNRRQPRQQPEKLASTSEIPAGQLADHEGMTTHPSLHEHALEAAVRAPQMPYPNRRVDQGHRVFRERRRGIVRAVGSVPPNAANRRAAAWVISASRPALTRAVFSAIPVNRLA